MQKNKTVIQAIKSMLVLGILVVFYRYLYGPPRLQFLICSSLPVNRGMLLSTVYQLGS